MKILALDFDGVLFCGLREVFITAANTYQSITGSKFFSDSYLEFDAFEKYPALEGYYNKFRQLYCYGRGGHYQFIMIKAIVDNKEIKSQEELDSFVDSFPKGAQGEYKTLFYEERAKLRDIDFEKWMELYEIFAEIVETLPKLPPHIKPVITTAKDEKSVKMLLKHFNIKPEMGVLDKEYGINKAVHLERLKQEFGLSSKDICLVDDRLPVLSKAQKTGVPCLMALWGSNTSSQQKSAVEQGIGLVDQEEFYDKVCSILSE